MRDCLKFIDLFAGLGGMRIGLEAACKNLNIESECVFSSEIKPAAIATYQQNFKDNNMRGDISKIVTRAAPDFDILLAGFPCQPFSTAGKREGFLDTRGTLFFEIERILQDKSPFGFLLENVEGLVKHDRGRTLNAIVTNLKNLGYRVSWKVLNAVDFGIPQNRKRIYLVGNKFHPISLDLTITKADNLKGILQQGYPTLETEFVKKLLDRYSLKELSGKAIKDKRGGKDNIHSWDLELKGTVSSQQKNLLNLLLKQRRRKEWSAKKGIHWMDGIPLTLAEIQTFYPHSSLKIILDDLVDKDYLKYEHPKDIVEVMNKNGKQIKKREYRTDLEKGYNIIVGKLSFEINKILDPNDIAPTLLATDMNKLAVIDGDGLRRLTIREGLRLFGFPETYQIDLPVNQAFDLLGNTVVIPIIEEISKRIIVQKLISISNKIYNFSPVKSK